MARPCIAVGHPIWDSLLEGLWGVYGYGGVHTLGGSAWHCVHGICTHGRRFSCIGGLCTHLRVCMHGAVRAFGVRAGGGLENTERL